MHIHICLLARGILKIETYCLVMEGELRSKIVILLGLGAISIVLPLKSHSRNCPEIISPRRSSTERTFSNVFSDRKGARLNGEARRGEGDRRRSEGADRTARRVSQSITTFRKLGHSTRKTQPNLQSQ